MTALNHTNLKNHRHARAGVCPRCGLATHPYQCKGSPFPGLCGYCRAKAVRAAARARRKAIMAETTTTTTTTPAPARYRGCLLGLAAGDALGTTLEFKRPGTFAPVTDIVGGGPFGLPAGAWTDDTSMALCLAESLVECHGFDARDQMERYCRWWHTGHLSSIGRCFDIGGTTAGALARYQATGEPYAGITDPQSAGNGSLMRLAPAALARARDDGDLSKLMAWATLSSQTTHGAAECIGACVAFAVMLRSAVRGEWKEAVLAAGLPVVRPSTRLADILAGSYRRKSPPAVRGTGYVIDCLEAALWAFHNADDFRAGALLAANLGDDADTTAAVYGQLAGAFYGEAGIPAAWRKKLVLRGTIERLADGLYALAGW